MDKDNLFKAIIAAAVAFMLWNLLTRALLPPPPEQPPQQQAAAREPAAPGPATPQNKGVRGVPDERFLELGNTNEDPDSPYPFTPTFSNRGAAVVSVRLTDHAANVKTPERYTLLAPVELENLKSLYSFATQELNLDNQDSFYLTDVYWHSKRQDAQGRQQISFWLDFYRANDEQPFAKLTKTYTLIAQPDHNGHNDLEITLKFENLSDDPLLVRITQLGPIGVPQEDPRHDQRKIVAGVDDGTQITLVSHANTSIKAEFNPKLVAGGPAAQRLEWAALGNKFFAAIMAPEEITGGANWIADAEAIRLAGVKGREDDATFKLVTTGVSVQPNQALVRSFDCYLGPKLKELFTADPTYAARKYYLLVEEDYYWCAWGPIVNIMLWLLSMSYAVIPNYGIAIIILVVVVRTILHPLTKKGQVNMTRMAGQMAVLQPKMEEIRNRHANDKTKLNQEMMKLYQQEGVNPAGQMLTCLPMMCQMPIWGGLWAALNFTVEMRHQPFCLWIKDLTAPDAFFTWDAPLPLIGTTFNLLPILLGLSMWLQQRFMPKPATAVKQGGKTTDQMAQQRMMMYFMSVFMVFIFYSAPSGLALYIMASNFFGLAEQHFIRKHIKEQEEAEKALGPKQLADKKSFQKPRFLQKLEKLAEEAKKK